MRLAEKKFAVFLVRGADKHIGNGVFTDGYRVTRGTFKRFNKKIYARVVFNKAPLKSNGGRDWSILNQWQLIQITDNKWRTYQLLKKFMKPTFRTTDKKSFAAALKKIKGERVVYKPIHGSEGKGIVIGSKTVVAKKLRRYDGLIQEYIDTSSGVPGVCRERHDMRVLLMNGTIVQSYVRIPRPDSHLANIAQGGRMLEIPYSAIPPAAKKIVKQIDRLFRHISPRMYAVDFGFEQGRPYIFELNPRAGFPYKAWKRYYHHWHQSLLKTLWSALTH